MTKQQVQLAAKLFPITSILCSKYDVMGKSFAANWTCCFVMKFTKVTFCVSKLPENSAGLCGVETISYLLHKIDVMGNFLGKFRCLLDLLLWTIMKFTKVTFCVIKTSRKLSSVLWLIL